MNRSAIDTALSLVFAATLAISPLAVALEADRSQKVEFSADGDSTMRIEDGHRIIHMSDNVRVTQGSLEILGEEAVFEYNADGNELTRVTVHGAPVLYSQQIDDAGNVVQGRSATIVFFTDADNGETVIHLLGGASIQSPDTTLSCVEIVYIVERNLMPSTTGPCEGTLAGENR